MAFTQIGTITATTIKDISIQLFDPDPTSSESQSASYSVQIGFSDGSTQVRRGSLLPHLTGGQITQLQTFLADLRTQAENELLPSP